MHASVHDLLNSHDYTMALSTFQGARFKYLPVHSATLLPLLSAPGGDLPGLIALGTSVTSTAVCRAGVQDPAPVAPGEGDP
jgi:hypothetical protein